MAPTPVASSLMIDPGRSSGRYTSLLLKDSGVLRVETFTGDDYGDLVELASTRPLISGSRQRVAHTQSEPDAGDAKIEKLRSIAVDPSCYKVKAIDCRSIRGTLGLVSHSEIITTKQMKKAEIKADKQLVVASRELFAWFQQDAEVKLVCFRCDVEATPAQIAE